MTLASILRLALNNLSRRKLRAVLTVWGMSVGIGAMVLLISFASGLQKQNEEQLTESVSLTTLTVSKVKMNTFGSSNEEPKPFEPKEIERIKSFAHVKAVYPVLTPPPVIVVVDGKRQDGFFTPTTIEDISESRKKQLEKGTWWTSDKDQGIVLTADTIARWQKSIDDVVGKKVTIIAQQFSGNNSHDGKSYEATVTGVLKPSSGFNFAGDAMAYNLAQTISLENPSDFFGQTIGNDQYESLTVYVDDRNFVDDVRQQVTDAGWFASGLEELLDSLNQGFLIMKIVLGVIGGIALFVALIGIANSMLMAVLERTKEIGILSALGASPRTISLLFLSEAGWLGIFGAIVGIGGAYVIGQAITGGISAYLAYTDKSGSELSFIKFHIGWELFVGTLVGAILVTLFAGWWPARRAAKLDPIRALRYE